MKPGAGAGAPAAGVPELRDRLLDAAEVCFRRHGIANTTIEDIVREARVPRATLYRHAGGKNDLVAVVLTREAERFFERLGEFVASRGTFVDVIIDGTIFAVRDLGSHDLLFEVIFTNESHTVIDPALDLVRVELWARMTAFVAPLVERAWRTGEARPELSVEDATEWLQRCINSLLLAPHPGRTDAELRAFLERMFLPAFVPDWRD